MRKIEMEGKVIMWCRADSLYLSLAWARLEIHSFLSEVSVCWSCREKITIKIERAFSAILRASPTTRRSFQQSPQLSTVAATSSSCCNLWQLSYICFPDVISRCQTGKLFPNSKSPEVVSSDRTVQLYYYSNI